jgi:hypothetical protein
MNSMIDSVHPTGENTMTNNYSLCIGRVSNGQGFNYVGLLDDVTLWNRPLMLKEIRRLSFQILNGNERGLVGYW